MHGGQKAAVRLQADIHILHAEDAPAETQSCRQLIIYNHDDIPFNADAEIQITLRITLKRTSSFLQPFVDSNHPVHSYFLQQEYAIALPVGALVLLLSFILVFLGVLMVKSRLGKKKAS